MKAWLVSTPKKKKFFLVCLFFLFAFFLFYISYLTWGYWISMDKVASVNSAEKFKVKHDFIKTVAQVLGGFFFLFGLYFTWKNLVLTQEKNRSDSFIAQEKQTTELFTKAIEHLASDRLEVRLGGIYALKRIAQDSEKDHGPIMEVLTAYVRTNAPWPPQPLLEARKNRPWARARPKDQETSPPETWITGQWGKNRIKPDPDIQAVLKVIGQPAATYKNGEDQPLDLRETDLRGADLHEAQLEGAILKRAHLEAAELQSANLKTAKIKEAYMDGANLIRANLVEADLWRANLKGALLGKAHLEGASLWGANLEEANFDEARLEHAILVEAHLEKADLEFAYLEKATLHRACLSGADLKCAHLQGADFQEADLRSIENLEPEQLRPARNWVLAFLPENLLTKLGLPPDHNSRLAKRDLSSYDLTGMDLRKAYLSDVKGLTREQLAAAITDETTTLPDYLKKPQVTKPEAK
jgi:uncharacterized protein YjbI with pentapeptide repeats